MVREDGAVLRLGAGGTVLGPFRKAVFEQEQVELRRGDRVLLFTDGVSEAFDDNDEEFGEDRLTQLVSSQPDSNAQTIVEMVLSSVTSFCKGDFHDDATLIAFTVQS